jgi:hypothetical protein
MTIDAQEALQQAQMTAHDYTHQAILDLCKFLDIKQSDLDWRKQLAPFAPVLAAMIAVAAQDYDTACHSGVVVGTLAYKRAVKS